MSAPTLHLDIEATVGRAHWHIRFQSSSKAKTVTEEYAPLPREYDLFAERPMAASVLTGSWRQRHAAEDLSDSAVFASTANGDVEEEEVARWLDCNA